MTLKKKCFLLGLLCMSAGSGFAQHAAELSVKVALPAGMEQLNKGIIIQSGLYNGRDYQIYPPSIQGSAYFQDAEVWSSGWLVYDGVRFDSIQLMYDLNKDLLVSMHYNGISRYSFVSEKVSEFNLFGHYFVNILPDGIEATSLRPGFYDLLYSGKVSILAKRAKSIQVLPGTNTTKRYFSEKNNYFIKKDGKYHSVNNERAFLSLFDDEKRDMRRHLKDNRVRYRTDPEKAMVLLATYYNTLP